MNKYLNGTILEMLERVKALKTKIPVSTLPDGFKQLAATATTELDKNINDLERLFKDPKFQVVANLPFKLNAFQKLVGGIDYLENYIIASLNRCSVEDKKLTKLVDKICKEIKYPLLSPVASRLSQNYYCIHHKFNLLAVPLLESEFLLHMPDLYHELAHPIISTQNHPSVSLFQEKLGHFNLFIFKHFEEQIKEQKRNNGEHADYLEVFTESWIEGWSIEMFCDLFGAFTLGPSYAWAHLHLCVKRGNNPFDTPALFVSTHPADEARMQVILFGLEQIGFKEEVKEVRKHWDEYLNLSGGTKDANFKLAYPKHILEHCAMLCLEATKGIKCQIANRNSQDEIYLLLNTAWAKFINDPLDYIGWERLQREKYSV
ncbi:MAG TPA: hypothetical protein PKC72_09215 [Chitinophagaceae bacterium]|nr:hypothetical protein [Chitinophagaceae bacterium]